VHFENKSPDELQYAYYGATLLDRLSGKEASFYVATRLVGTYPPAELPPIDLIGQRETQDLEFTRDYIVKGAREEPGSSVVFLHSTWRMPGFSINGKRFTVECDLKATLPNKRTSQSPTSPPSPSP
jgi:hypothetical protein